MSVESAKSRNDRIRTELRGLIRTFGSLDVRLSGEGLISFTGLAKSGYVGFMHQLFDGDTGCMSPLKGYDTWALDQVFNMLSNLVPVPSMGDQDKLPYVPSKDEWIRKMEDFRNKILKDPLIDVYEGCIRKEIPELGESVIVATIRIEPVINRFVATEYQVAKYGEIIGTVKNVERFQLPQFGQSERKWNCDIVIEPFDQDAEEKLHMDEDNTCVFRDIIPEEGDFILRDGASGKFAVLPKVDYPGAFH